MTAQIDILALLPRAIAGDAAAMRTIVDIAAPVIHAQVARTLLRSKDARSYDLRETIKEFTQDVFVLLLKDNGHVLRQWDPRRKRSFTSFVALVAKREVISSLRSEKRNPWTETPTEDETLNAEPNEMPSPIQIVASRQTLAALIKALEDRLDARRLELFYLLIVDETSTEEICEIMGMTPQAVYAQHTRFRRLLQALLAELES